jgi:ABC-type glutathione transport system ATPase component
MTLLQVSDLRVSFARDIGQVQAVAGVSFALKRGELLALVGESGSGKSLTALSLMGLTRRLGARVSGSARLAREGAKDTIGAKGTTQHMHAAIDVPHAAIDVPSDAIDVPHAAIDVPSDAIDLLSASELQLRRLRGARMAMVFQDPMSSLNPVQRVGWQIAEQIRAHEPLVSRGAAWERARELMDRVGIARAGERVRAYPHELSGGMRQRVMIAMALSCSPDLLLADEPTTALDVTTQAQILAHLKALREQTDMGILLITHDLGVVAEVAQRVLVMHAGRIVEQGSTQEIFTAAQHPYTQRLLAAYAPRPRRIPRAQSGAPLLQARELSVRFRRAPVPALEDVSLTLHEGETLGLVGESGGGKTTLIRCLLRLQQPTSGSVYFRGEDITRARRARMAPVRRELQMVFQDSQASLNPRRRVAAILAGGLRLRGVPRSEQRERAAALLKRVGLHEQHLDRYPHELSGGERQRVGIARALSCEPKAIVLDEPVSALDAPIRAQVLDLLSDLQAQSGMSYLMIAHDLAVVRDVADRVAVMHDGRIVELAPTQELFAQPRHPQTRALLAACLKLPGDVGSSDGRSEHADDRAAGAAVALQHGQPAW